MAVSIWKKEADNDRLKMGDKIGQLFSIVLTGLMAVFFIIHWTSDSGFFTDAFNDTDAALFIVAFIFSLAPVMLKLVLGVKNKVRPWEAASMVFFILASLYFLSNFHFDMQFLADPLPNLLKWAFEWLDEGWVRIFMMIGVFGGAIGTVWNIVTYIKVKELLEKN